MKLNILAIKDIKTGHFDQKPIPVIHSGEIIREFEDLKKNPETKFGKHPEDFNLYAIGTYDTETGELASVHPVMLA